MLSNTAMIAIALTFASAAGFALALRLWCRLVLIKNPGYDDYIIILSYSFALAFSILIPVQVNVGLGKHASDLTSEQYRDYLRPFWASVLVYTVSLNLTKMSILQQYLRFMTGPRIRRLTWTVMWIVVVYTICTTFLCIFTCVPVSYFWTQVVDKKGGHCLNKLGLWFAQASFNIISDIVILILPMSSIYQIRLPKKQKIGLMLVFAIGFFVCCISIIRLQSLYSVSHSTDTTWSNVSAATWSTVESQIAIICACLPAIRPLVSALFPSVGSHHDPESGGSGLARRGSRLPHYSDRRASLVGGTWQGHRLDQVHIKRNPDSIEQDSVKDGQIKVVTVMAQQSDSKSDSESQRKIIWDR